jgi:hypothetical protein
MTRALHYVTAGACVSAALFWLWAYSVLGAPMLAGLALFCGLCGVSAVVALKGNRSGE